MKKLIITSVLALLLAGGGAITAQDYPKEYLGLPGDNFNLYAVMNLFQESETLEAFERSINEENSRINNLDLNGDNLVDYIMVSDFVDGDVHNIVLRVALNSRDFQDVAVFTVQKFSDGSVQIQLIGDEALYGKDYIIEPIYAETPNPGYTGRASGVTRVVVAGTTYYEVAAWPVVRYIYHPTYTIWRSSWYWGYWPVYWNPWRPYYWHFYYGYHYNWYPHYYNRYHHWNVYRYAGYRDYYYNSVRIYSPVVVVNINNGNYRNTYSRPEQRRTGEEFYANVHRGQSSTTVSNSNAVNQSRRASVPEAARVQSTTASSNQRRDSGTVNSSSATQRSSGNTVNVSAGNNAADRRAGSAAQSGTVVQRSSSTSSGNSATVQRSSTATQRNSGTAVQRSSNTASGSSSTVRNSTGTASRSTATVQSNSGTASRSSAAVQRSSTATQRSSGTAVQRSSTSTQRSSGTAAQKSNSSAQKSSGTAVQRSSSSSSKSGSTGNSSSGKSTSSSRRTGSGR